MGQGWLEGCMEEFAGPGESHELPWSSDPSESHDEVKHHQGSQGFLLLVRQAPEVIPIGVERDVRGEEADRFCLQPQPFESLGHVLFWPAGWECLESGWPTRGLP